MAFKSYLDLSVFVPKRHWTLDLLFRNVLCIPLDVLGRIVLFFFSPRMKDKSFCLISI